MSVVFKNQWGERLYHLQWRSEFGKVTEGHPHLTLEGVEEMGFTVFTTNKWFTMPGIPGESNEQRFRVTVRDWSEADQATYVEESSGEDDGYAIPHGRA